MALFNRSRGANVEEIWAIRLPSEVEFFWAFFWHRGSAEGEHFADPVGMDQIERDCYSYIRGGREKNIDRVRGMLLWCISTSSQAFVPMGRHVHG